MSKTGKSSPAQIAARSKTKKASLRWPEELGIYLLKRIRPDPDDPGGLGAEESGAERTGPTQFPCVRNPARRWIDRNRAALWFDWLAREAPV